jgi:septal ring factor EnvC (AmiA/AmiB activator)
MADDDDLDTQLEWPADPLGDDEDDTDLAPGWTPPEPPSAPFPDAPDLFDSDPLLPALNTRMETLHAAAASLSTRVDGLVASTTSFRSLMVDRLSEYMEQVARAQRTQASDLEEYRHSADRVVAELRTSVMGSEELLHTLRARTDELSSDIASLAELARSSIVEGREFNASTDKVTRSVREGLDGFTTRVLERLDQIREAFDAELGSVRADNTRLRKSVADAAAGWNTSRVETIVDELREDVRDLRAVVIEWTDPQGLRDEIAALRTSVPEALGEGALDDLRTEVTSLHQSIEERLAVGAMAPLVEELGAVRTELAALRRRMSVRAKSEPLVSDEQLEALVQAVVDRLSSAFEVVDSAEPGR